MLDEEFKIKIKVTITGYNGRTVVVKPEDTDDEWTITCKEDKLVTEVETSYYINEENFQNSDNLDFYKYTVKAYENDIIKKEESKSVPIGYGIDLNNLKIDLYQGETTTNPDGSYTIEIEIVVQNKGHIIFDEIDLDYRGEGNIKKILNFSPNSSRGVPILYTVTESDLSNSNEYKVLVTAKYKNLTKTKEQSIKIQIK